MSGESDPNFRAIRPGGSDVTRELLTQFSSLHRTVNAIDVRCARIEQRVEQHGQIADDVEVIRERFATELRRVETEAREAREKDRRDLEAKLAIEHDRVLTLKTQAVTIATVVSAIMGVLGAIVGHFLR
jgi:hypothetical protein